MSAPKIIWWIDAQQDIPSQFEKLAISLNSILPTGEKIETFTLSKDALVDRVKDILRVKNIRFLLIFDNAETYAQLEKYIPYVSDSAGAHVLLTSRHANIWTDRVEVGKFERKESISLIKKTLSKEKDEDVQRLAESLSDYPLGLTLAVGFIKSSPTTTIDKYLAMHMKRTLKKGDEMPNSISDSYSKDALAALEISLKSIEEKSKDALKTLFFMSLLNSKDIPEVYIELWLKKMKSPLTADEAIKYIYDQSLIGVSEKIDPNIKGKYSSKRVHYLSIHDLIHQLLKEKLPIEEKKKLIDTAAEVMLEVFSGTAEIFTTKITKEPIHLLHAQKLCETANKLNYLTPNLLKLKICIFECLMGGFRNFEDAKIFIREIEQDVVSGLVIEPYYKAILKINQGFLETANVDFDKALAYMKEGLSILTSLKVYRGESLRAITNIAQYYILRGEISLAEEYINRGKRIFTESPSPNYNCLFIFVWSMLLTNQGKLEDSLEVLNKAKKYPHLSADSPTIDHAILNQKIETFIKQERAKEASTALEEYERKTREFFQKKQGKILANILVYRSLILLYEKKNITEVFQNILEAIKSYEELFHGSKVHRNQARAYFVLGKAHLMNEEYEAALNQYLKSEEIYSIALKEKKIDDVSELYKELAILGATLKDEELVHKYLNAHIHTFGHSHPRTQEIILYLDKEGVGIPF